jgi:hypothetical protein
MVFKWYQMGWRIYNNTKLKTMKTKVRYAVNEMTHEILAKFHTEYKTMGGDITPHQLQRLEELQNQFSNLLCRLVFQNIDLSKIEPNLESMDYEDLMELANHLDWNGSWDIDEEGQAPITKEELIEAISSMLQDY